MSLSWNLFISHRNAEPDTALAKTPEALAEIRQRVPTTARASMPGL